MASKEQIARRRAILRKRGVPEAFVDKIATRRSNAWAWIPALLIYMGIFAACAAVYVKWRATIDHILTWPYHDEITGSLLFVPQVTYHLFGYALIMLLTWTQIILSSMGRGTVKAWPAYDATAADLRTLDTENESFDKVKVTFKPAELVGIDSEEAFLRYVKRRNKGLRLKILAWLFIAALTFWGASRFDYWKLMPDHIETHRYGAVVQFPLNEIRYVEIECKTGTGDDADTHGYTLVFPDRGFNIAAGNDQANDLGMNDLTRRMLRVDQTLRAKGFEIRRLHSDPACVSKWADGLDPASQGQLKALFAAP
jgi:hypothetical protein